MKHFFYSLFIACILVVCAGFSLQAHAEESTPSAQTNQTALTVNLLLHGLGRAGDSVNQTPSGNMQPLHTQRAIRVKIFDDQKNIVATKEGSVVFDQATGKFTGTLMLADVPSGTYGISIKADRYLSATLYDPQVITQGQTTTLPAIPLNAGDINNDDLIDIVDYGMLMDCFSSLMTSVCSDATKEKGDLTDDGTVNQFDYNLFLRELSTS